MNIHLNGLIMDRMRPTRKIITIQMDSDDPDRMQIRFEGFRFQCFSTSWFTMHIMFFNLYVERYIGL